MFTKWRRQREQRALERKHRAWLTREQPWWEFQLDMDFLSDKISYEEMVAWRKRIKLGQEYVGWARRNKVSTL